MRKIRVESRRRLLDDFLKVDEAYVSFERDDGSYGDSVRLVAVERGDSVAALVKHRESGDLLLIEQFRFPTYDRGVGWMTELMAGMIDPGESPETAVRRELKEELGYDAAIVVPVTAFFASPGASSERIWLYYVEVSDAGRSGEGGGVGDERDRIRTVRMTVEEALSAAAAGKLPDAKTIIGLQWLQARGAA